MEKCLPHKFALLLCLMTVSAFMGGCASQGKSIGLGGVIGAGTGAALGGIMDPGKEGQYRTRNVIIGSVVGGVAGSFAGASFHESKENEKELAYLKGRDTKSHTRNPTPPELQEPRVEAQWVESKISGNKWVEGHFEYVITEPSRWAAP
jgi:hypothetical protein